MAVSPPKLANALVQSNTASGSLLWSAGTGATSGAARGAAGMAGTAGTAIAAGEMDCEMDCEMDAAGSTDVAACLAGGTLGGTLGIAAGALGGVGALRTSAAAPEQPPAPLPAVGVALKLPARGLTVGNADAPCAAFGAEPCSSLWMAAKTSSISDATRMTSAGTGASCSGPLSASSAAFWSASAAERRHSLAT